MTLPQVQVWTGPAGSGKSTRIVDDIATKVAEAPLGAPIYWVVPDDVAFFAEQMLVRKLPSVLRAEVITMSRLADRIRNKAGNTHLVNINRAGKRLLLAAAYAELRDDLTMLGNVQATGGFYDLVLDTFDEMTSYNVNLAALQGALETASASLESLVSASSQSGHSLIGKLRDLCALYVRYRRMLDERAFFDPALNLADAAARVADVAELQEAELYVDGFNWLRPNQLEFAQSLAQTVKQATFVFSIVHAPAAVDAWRERAVFAEGENVGIGFVDMLQTVAMSEAKETPSSAVTLLQLIEKLEQVDVPYVIEAHSETKRFSAPALRAVEQLFHAQIEPEHSMFQSVERDGMPNAEIRLWRASTADEESRAVARDILRLVDEQRVTYQHIAVVVPELNERGRMMSDALTDLHIPHAIDAFPTVAGHPLGRFTIAVLRFVASDMSVDSAARLLRTAFTGLGDADATWLDIYIRQYQVEGSDAWLGKEAWTFAASVSDEYNRDRLSRADERANRFRLRLMRTFGVFFHQMDKGTVTPYELATALWALFEAVDAKEALAQQIVREDVEQNPLQASQDEQVWQQFVNLLNDLATVYQDAHFVREELFELVIDLLVAERQTTIPSGVNQVFVTSYRNAHTWSKSHVYVVGLSRENLPKWSRTPALLQDDERAAFRTLFGASLAPSSLEQLDLDRELAYRLLTRAADHLTLSYPVFAGGFERLPSRVYQRISRQLFLEPVVIGDVTQNNHTDGGPLPTSDRHSIRVLTAEDALSYLVSHLSAAKQVGDLRSSLSEPALLQIGQWFAADTQRRSTFLHAVRGLQHRLPNGFISRELATELYGTPLKTSVNRLETYASCPYRYFLRYGLGVEPLVFDSLEAVDIGNLLHDTIYDLIKLDRDEEVDFRQLTLTDMLSLADIVYQAQLDKQAHAVFKSRKWREARAEDLATYVRNIAEILFEHANRGRYRPYALEWSFGLDDHSSESLTMTLVDGEEVWLRGRIDRLDTYMEDGVTWFRIFDYKSGANHRVDLTRLFYGLQMQLFVYLAAVKSHLSKLSGTGEVRPAGAFYIPMLTQPGISEVPADDHTAKAQLHKLFRAQGYMNSSKNAIAAMDERLAQMQSSALFGSMYRKDGRFLKTAKVWTDAEWETLISFTMEQVQALSTQLVQGKIPVRPYFISHDARACTHCDFAAVCQFEPADHAQSYRMVTAKTLDNYMSSVSDGGDDA